MYFVSQVLSYGMILLETIGRRKITEDMLKNTNHVYYPQWIYNPFEGSKATRIHADDEGDAKISKKLTIAELVHTMPCCGSTINASCGSNVGLGRREIINTYYFLCFCWCGLGYGCRTTHQRF
ncbi:putative glycerophosphodiester phosphodiesterase [Lupinus albus]|uniref:Putative glycerophosphodiester phosphodiesterase n=1 Tax=Lupinus albus TaxID=3870 RepID=A0A6A4Q5H5_LUPAL|nr:putative glycerophosphodiester phosphodiesterase [Lupinus albus]